MRSIDYRPYHVVPEKKEPPTVDTETVQSNETAPDAANSFDESVVIE